MKRILSQRLLFFLKVPRKQIKGRLQKVFFLFILFSANLIFAQTTEVSGTIIASDSGAPLPGVTVLEKGTSNGVITDFDGNYSINLSGENAVLVFSFVGYATQEVSVNGQSTINVTMQVDMGQLDEVVIVDYGYGRVRKEDMTGSVATIGSQELAKIPVASAAEALSGRLPGVNVTTADGEPGAEVRIRVRGGGSVTQSNEPLYVVDGFIVDGIRDIPPTDIESINVLKDAAATAVYGAQAANGVVVVTTKNPVAGKTTVTYNNFFQFNTLPEDRRYEVLSPYEYVLANYEYARLQSTTALENFERFFGVYDDIDIYRSREGTDWQEELFGDPRLSQYHNLTVGGGTDRTKMNLSVTHNDDEGLLDNSGFKRTAINFKLNQQIVDDKLDLDISTRIADMVTDGAGTSTNAQIKIKDAVQTRPVSGIADEIEVDLNQVNTDDDYQQFLRSLVSPVELAEQDWRKREQNNYVLNAGLNWSIIEQLQFRSTFTTEKNFDENKRFFGPLTSESFNNGGSMPLGQKTTSTSYSYRWLNTLNFQYSEWEDHKLDFLLGQEIYSNGGESTFVRAEQFRLSITPEELFANMSFGEFDRLQTQEATETNRLSGFGRLDYQFKNRYMITATFRADASSRFSEENRWGFFPALALGWKIAEEEFLQDSDFVDELKLRLSYGQTGNDRIDPTATQFLFSPNTFRGPGFNDREQVYYSPSSDVLYNPDVKWETTINRNLGLDFVFLNRRINGSLDLYYNTTKDLLLRSAIPPTSGFSTQWNNVGTTSNKGVELGINAGIIESADFNLSANFNIGLNRAKIEELDGTDERFFRSNWASTDLNNINDFYLRVGGTIGDVYGYVTDGYYTTDDFASYDEASDEYILREGVPNSTSVVGNTDIRPGFLKLKDLNEDGIINAEDRKVIGNTLPDFQGGLGFNANFKGFDASIFFNFQYGNDVYNTGKIQFNQFRRITYGNLLTTMSSDNRFTYIDVDGEYTGTPGAVVTDLDQLADLNSDKNIWSHVSHGVAGAVVHSWAIEDGSFIRLNNLTLGYSLPKDVISQVGLSRFRVYAAGRNLHIWTNYSGYDPEVNSTNNGLTPGVDFSSYPRSRSYAIGLNLSF
ncbi:TonB-dependent receptor [Gramella jeungdoensis]|uniref:TonB-dependent receptor n=1 Tax=Gramella jeungdoensis TaxID=708091 RepID=A0ABT0YYJ6_9FLAO|nr:TonB-dependent receptor [Gramella jeungdoensis]MCM8568404.1 TonB-dependent receptor [Gramella jeungdoensis]